MSTTNDSNSKNLAPTGNPQLNGGTQSSGDLNFREYVEIFGDDLKPVLEDKIVSLNEDIERLQDLKEAKIEALQRKFENDNLLGRSFSKWFVRTWLKYSTLLNLEQRILKKKKELKRILTAYNFISPFKEDKNLDIETAKLTLIETIYYGKLKRISKRLVGLCPFHKEKTPSFTIFTETNSFHCFGCKESGDVITFMMKSNNLKFPEAVRRLGG